MPGNIHRSSPGGHPPGPAAPTIDRTEASGRATVPTQTRALIVEENLGRTAGHYEPWIEGIAEAFRQHGLEVTILGATRAKQLPSGYPIEPWLPHNYLDAYLRVKPSLWRRLLAALGHNLRLFQRLAAWFRRRQPYDLVMATQVNVFHLLGWRLTWMIFGRWKIRRLVLNSLVPMWLFEYDDLGNRSLHKGAKLVALSYQLFSSPVRRGEILLTAETDHEACSIGAVAGVPVVALPTPRPESLIRAARQRMTERRDGGARPPVLGWLGRCSEEKGFSLFFDACRQFLTTNPSTPCTILIQYLVGPDGCRLTEAEIDHLANSDARVRVLKESASGDEYGRLVGELDCLVLPYLRRNYVGRNSSAALDAVLAGIPIITTEGTWMAELMHDYGAGLTCRDRDAAHLAACLAQAVACSATLGEQAWSRSERAREIISWTHFASRVFPPE